MNNLYKAKWEKGKNNTLHFYTAKLPWKEKQFNHPFPLYSYFSNLIGDKKEVKIADVGSGMFCTIGSTWPNTKVEVYPSDALAPEFNQILEKHGVKALIPVKHENAEKLSYEDNTFDIVNCCNALDHTADPIRAISEMYRVVKPGGCVYLRHFPNVGEMEQYAGLHMWNFDIDDGGRCIIWNKNDKFILNETYKNIMSVKKQELDYEPNNMVVCIIQKI